MGDKVKRRGLKFLISLLCAFAVLLFFPKHSGKEFFFETEWIQKLPRQLYFGESRDRELPLIPYKNSHMFGYSTIDGDIIYTEPIIYNAAESEDFFINYSSVSETLLIKNTTGEISATISSPGYPVIKNERLFILDVDRCGIAEWDLTGEKLWGKRYPSLITSFDCSRSETVVGLLNGEVLLYNREGDYLYRDQSTESRVQIVYAAALSGEGTHFAVIEGLDPQRLLLFERRDEGYVPVHTERIANPLRREAFVMFSKNDDYLFFEGDGVLNRLDLRKRSINKFTIIGAPLAVDYLPRFAVHIIHSGGTDASVLDVFSEGGFHVNRFFLSPGTTVGRNGNALFFQRGRELYRLDIKESSR